jgi:ribosomal protein L11 methyltransferase
VLTAESPSEALVPTLAEGLIALGGSAVEESGSTLRTYLPWPDGGDPERVAAEAARRLADAAGTPSVAVRWRAEHDEDWLSRWRAGLKPRRVGERFIIAPTWTAADLRPDPDDLLIIIDPQMAFGTGEHASTRGVLRLLERAVLPGMTVLDVGTGSGVLAIAAKRLGAGDVHAVESDADAIDNARENLARNGCADVVLECALVDAARLDREAARYDLIAANVLRSVLEPLLPGFRRALRPRGSLLIAGILQSESATMVEAAARAGFTLRAEDREDGWWAGALIA